MESFFGLGSVDIHITVESENIVPQSLEDTGLAIGPFILLV
jgi:hypothetical protein